MAITQEDDRASARGQWTLKSRLLTQEVMIAIRLAAQRAEKPLGDWCADVLHEEARRVLGRPIEKPLPPARLEEVVAEGFEKLWERQQAELEARDQRLREEQQQALRDSEARITESIAGGLKGLAQRARRGMWRR